MADAVQNGTHGEGTRRDFMTLAGVALGAVGTGAVGWTFIDYMNPSADVLALASIELDLSDIAEGSAITAFWRGQPVFVRHRSAEEIELAEATSLDDLPDPQPDSERVVEPKWLIMVGVCTHLGCVPLGQKSGDSKGEYDGWFCPCHGSHYDTSGRIRKGPAPTNLPIPPYEFLSDTTIRIG